jgi:hypothetical protein
MPNSKASVGRSRKSKPLRAVVIGAAVALVCAAPAAAHRPPLHPPLPRPDDISSVNQYVEVIPTSRGVKATVGSHTGSTPTLSAALRTRLRAAAGPEASALERAVALGRPSPLAAPHTRTHLHVAGIGVVPHSERASLVAFVVVLAAITAVAAGGAALGRRRG